MACCTCSLLVDSRQVGLDRSTTRGWEHWSVVVTWPTLLVERRFWKSSRLGQGVAQELLVHPIFGMLLHSNRRFKVTLWLLCLSSWHCLAALRFYNALLQFFVCLYNVVSVVNWVDDQVWIFLLFRIWVQVSVLQSIVSCELRYTLLSWSSGLVLISRTFSGYRLHKHLPCKCSELVHFPFTIFF